MRPAGGNWKTLRRYAHEVWDISTAHFDADAGGRRAARDRARPLAELLVVDSTYSRGSLKQRLYTEGVKDRHCELCGQGEEWRGRHMALILDHINGIATDNRLENLQIVCPNCAATLDTHCGRNLPRHDVEIECGRCGSRSCASGPSSATARAPAARGISVSPALAWRRGRSSGRRTSHWCVRSQRRATSPSADRYGVSDNAIRKWVRAYERELGVVPLPRAA